MVKFSKPTELMGPVRIIIIVPCCTSLLDMHALRHCSLQGITTTTYASQLTLPQFLSPSFCFNGPSLAGAPAIKRHCRSAFSHSHPSCARYRTLQTMASSSSTPRPLRIACLHGFLQNAKQFRRKTGGLRKSLRRDIALIRGEPPKSRSGPRQPLAELYYLDAPFILERIGRNLAVDHTTEQQGGTYRTVYSPVVCSASEESSEDSRIADATTRTWIKTEGRNYVDFEKTLEYLHSEFAEKVGPAKECLLLFENGVSTEPGTQHKRQSHTTTNR